MESGAAEEAVAAFDEQSGVLSARLNDTARSIVVHYDERVTDVDALAEGVRKSGVTLKVIAQATLPSSPPARTKFAAWVSQNARSADERLLVKSRGSVDLRRFCR